MNKTCDKKKNVPGFAPEGVTFQKVVEILKFLH